MCSSGAQSDWSLLLLSSHAAACFTDVTRGGVDSKEREVNIRAGAEKAVVLAGARTAPGCTRTPIESQRETAGAQSPPSPLSV